jgi:hypothetical protein
MAAGDDHITMTDLPNSIAAANLVTINGDADNDTLTGQAGVNAFTVSSAGGHAQSCDAGQQQHVDTVDPVHDD